MYFWTFLNFITTCFFLYQAIVALAGLRKRKPLPEPDKNHRFAAIIAARNEESVIQYLIESIRMQNYPQELIDVIVVADNCDDDTAKVAEKAGAIVYKRFNKAEIGKSYVLKFAFEKMAEEGIDSRYDAICIFDADNIVERNFFCEMNKAICAGYQVAQGYRDMKNPSDTWISGGHSIFYWMQNRFFDSGRGVLGLSATINGTGYMVTMKHLKKIGWNITTLTEDLEFTMQSVLSGEKVGWVPEAIVYDEQPLTLQQSMRQRIRWTNGYFQVSQKYLFRFLKKLADKKDWVTSDMCVFLTFYPVIIIGAVSILLYTLMAMFQLVNTVGFAINMLAFLGFGALGFWAIAIASLYTEKKSFKGLMKAILTYPLFNITWALIYLVCFFKKDTGWKPISHMRGISLKDIEASKAKSM